MPKAKFDNSFESLADLKSFYRRMIKTLHPDQGGNKEEFLEFLTWYRDLFIHFREEGDQVEVVKSLPCRGNYLYRCEEFSLEELLQLRQKSIVIPSEKPCLDCKGKGYDLGKFLICQRCKRHESFDFFNKVGNNGRLACSTCGGKMILSGINCSTCLGKGVLKEEKTILLKLPLGLQDGDFLFLAKNKYDLSQDVYLEVVIKEHQYYKRSGHNLYLEYEITIWDLLLQETFEIPTLEGKETILATYLRSNNQVILKGRGLYYLEKGNLKRGDLIVNIKIKIPVEVPLKVKQYLSLAYRSYQNFSTEE